MIDLVKNLKMVVAYEGTNFAGFQLQKNGPTIQAELEAAILEITSKKTNINGAGRTDSGVHAQGQVVNFYTDSMIPVQNLQKALNSVLPPTILVKSIVEVPLSFHARRSALTKTYSYRIYNLEQRPLFERNFVYHYKIPLNVAIIRQAIPFIIGERDFKSFQAAGSSVKTTIRTINYCNLVEDGSEIKIIINADGFLYHMVRNIVGTLFLVGNGRMDIQCFQEIIAAKDRHCAGPTAPAQGLCLEEVIY